MKRTLFVLSMLFAGCAEAQVRLSPIPTQDPVYAESSPRGRAMSVRLPAALPTSREIDVVVHAHGAAWLVHQSVEAVAPHMASVALQWGAGSVAYHTAAEDEEGMRYGLPEVLDTLFSSLAGDPLRVRRIYLTAFSAGHGALRVWLRDAPWRDRVAGVLLLDGLHTGFLAERPSRTLDPSRLEWFLPFARDAVAGERVFVLTHSEILPESFASTTETTNWLLEALDIPRTADTSGGAPGMRLTSRAVVGGLHIKGYAGDTADDHVDHLHALPHYLNLLTREQN